MAETAVGTKWTAERLERLTLELVANLLHKSVPDLEAELRVKGPMMPVDSLDMFDIVQEFREETGLRLPTKELGKNTLRSIKAFAEFAAQQGEAA